MSNAPAVLRIFGLIALIFSATMTLPLAVSWWLHDGAERVYRESLAVTLAAGALLFARLVDDADTDTIGAGPDAATYALNKLINEVESTKK